MVFAELPADLARERDARARDMIEVHGPAAAGVARENARRAAIAGRAVEARHWLRMVDTIQRRMVRSEGEPAARSKP